ncbi:MAG TPA: tyrosine-type recombinase/integrase [Mycobacteriales bacterium]|nr:tyrosine-type recombinase/integrase [Mycobacteriales bacterium]
MAYAKKRIGASGHVTYTAVYLDPHGRERSAGTFASKREAQRTARRAEGKVEADEWIDPTDGKITFERYVEDYWWPSRQLEVSTRAAYRSYLDKHFIPYFGSRPMATITTTAVEAWIARASADGLSPASVRKYHSMLKTIFKRAVRDRVVGHNPCAEAELPKAVAQARAIPSPEDFDRLLNEIPARWRLLVLLDVETGLRWGELVALRPRHVDFLRRLIHVQDVVVEVSKKMSPTGQRMIFKGYPKDDEHRVVKVGQPLIDLISAHITEVGLSRDDLLFSSTRRPGPLPVSRNTFRTRVWLPALQRAELGYHVRVHDLRHAHASWLLAGGADLRTVMARMGHSQVTTTQRYLHALPDADDQALAAFERIRSLARTPAKIAKD